MQKLVRVKFRNDDLERAYLQLSDEDPIKKRINFIIQRLKEFPSFGQPIAKNLIPKEYKAEGFTNAFWIELNKSTGARLIYSLFSENKTETTAVILDWFDRHKDYGRRFKYN